MKRILVILLILLPSLASAATSYRGYNIWPEPLPKSEGELLFKESGCVVCHGYQGQGDGFFAGGLNPRPRDYTDPEVQDSLTDTKITMAILYGVPETGMPAYAQFSPIQVQHLVRYIRSFALQSEDAPEPQTGSDPRRMDWAIPGATSRFAPQSGSSVTSEESDSAQNLYEAASLQIRFGNYKNGIRLLKESVEKDPQLADAHSLLGYILLNSKDKQPAEAMKHFERAIQLNPNDAMAHSGLGLAHVYHPKIGNLSDGVRHLREAIRLDSDDAMAHVVLGIIYNKKKRGLDSIYHLKQAERVYRDKKDLKNLARVRKILRGVYPAYGFEPGDFDFSQ